MILLTIGIAILDELTRLTRLETDAFLLHLAAFRAADVDLVHRYKCGRDERGVRRRERAVADDGQTQLSNDEFARYCALQCRAFLTFLVVHLF
jgi:hypothetical protein